MPGRGISSRHMADDAQLSRVERIALKFGEFANESPGGKWLQNRFHSLARSFTCGTPQVV